MHDDPRIEEAKATDIEGLAERLDLRDLVRRSNELVGPCPNCGGRDRFNLNVRSGVFLCRQCDVRGGDQIELVRQILGLSFPDALTWLCGDAPISEAEAKRRRDREAKNRAQREARAERERERVIADARAIWRSAEHCDRSIVSRYLERRGISPKLLPELPKAIRAHPALPYMVKADRGWREVHRGPVMLAAIHQLDGRLTAVHRTWLDLAQPKGKIDITVDGERLVAKKVIGSKKGAAIRLTTPPDADTMVVGEGIETTLTALVSGEFAGAAFWCAVDLGNMAGRMVKVPGRRHSGVPDMSDSRALVPPDWVKRLVFIKDGDSAEAMTDAKLRAGLKRALALRPTLDSAEIWVAPPGGDLNDLIGPAQ